MAGEFYVIFRPEQISGVGGWPQLSISAPASAGFGTGASASGIYGLSLIQYGFTPQIAWSNTFGITQECNCPPGTPPDEDPKIPPFVSDYYGREFGQMNLRMIKRDEYIFNISILQADKVTPLDLTGGTLDMMAKWSYSDADADAVVSLSSATTGIDITNATGGLARVTIPPEATENLPDTEVRLYYDIQFTTTANKPKTVERGELIVSPGVVKKL